MVGSFVLLEGDLDSKGVSMAKNNSLVVLDLCFLGNERAIYQDSAVGIGLHGYFGVSGVCESDMAILYSKAVNLNSTSCWVLSNFKFTFFDLEYKETGERRVV